MEHTGPILIVDDEPDLLGLVDLHLRKEGFETYTAMTGADALDAMAETTPALVVLDLMLPDMSGTEVCRRIRGNPATVDVPVIILSAKGEEIDRVVGFEVGADDYVVKNGFSARELVLRVRAVLRRRATPGAASAPVSEPVGANTLTFGPLRIDEEAHRVYVEADEVQLTATEFKLLATLARRAGRVQSRGRLLEDVWDMPPDLNTRTVDTHVKRLREKLGVASRHVETVRGVGYRFNATPRG
jgi:two-component system phosphate regulon response regulator PhoB